MRLNVSPWMTNYGLDDRSSILELRTHLLISAPRPDGSTSHPVSVLMRLERDDKHITLVSRYIMHGNLYNLT
jgi:hypothetical protein